LLAYNIIKSYLAALQNIMGISPNAIFKENLSEKEVDHKIFDEEDATML